MKGLRKLSVMLAVTFAFVLSSVVSSVSSFEGAVSVNAAAASATGYTKASDVKYVQVGNYIANWGARDEDCVFLSKYATSFYTGSYSYEQVSLNAGGSSTTTAPSSKLYKALQKMMKDEHSNETSYDATRDKFCYTDCVESNYSKISSFYSAKVISGKWDGGNTWNREHVWPNSKGDLAGNGENDIMMLRPASVSENSSRGNKAYGEGSGYYDPNGEGQSVRGDCARVVLYQYVRWGCTNTGSKYNSKDITGTDGVIESLNVLLRWMQEDPVDTWEMGRNDAVQSITGTRNVFVDYPEYAWLLFGKQVPANYQTPSGGADESPDSSNSSSSSDIVDSSDSSSSSNSSSSSSSSNSSNSSSSSGAHAGRCEHEYSEWTIIKAPTETENGLKQRTCNKCGGAETALIRIEDLGASSCNSSIGISSLSLLAVAGVCYFIKKRR